VPLAQRRRRLALALELRDRRPARRQEGVEDFDLVVAPADAQAIVETLLHLGDQGVALTDFECAQLQLQLIDAVGDETCYASISRFLVAPVL